MGLFPESLGGLRGLSVLAVVLLVVKSSSKKVQITSLMHIAVAPSDGAAELLQRRPPQLPYVATCPTCNIVAQGFIWEAAHHLA